MICRDCICGSLWNTGKSSFQKDYTGTIVITEEPDGNGYNVAVPALDGCFTFGDTLAEAITHAHEAIDLYTESLVERGLPLPEDVRTMITTVQVKTPLTVAS